MGTSNYMDVSVFQKTKKGNYYCGDSYFFKETEEEFICALADGLGSGEYAKESSDIVIHTIEKNPQSPVQQLVKRCQKDLIGKRGAVIGILKVNFTTNTYTFSSIGNIGMMTVSADNEKKRIIPNSGYLGSYPSDIKVSHNYLTDGMMFVMFSDGVDPKELSSSYFLGKDVKSITQLYASRSEGDQDDTTLISMKYLSCER